MKGFRPSLFCDVAHQLAPQTEHPEPVKNLLLSILKSNLQFIQAYVSGDIVSNDSLLRSVEALLWLRGRSDRRKISVENVCDHLGYDHDRLLSDAATHWIKTCPDRYQLLHGVVDQYIVEMRNEVIAELQELATRTEKTKRQRKVPTSCKAR